MPEYSRRQFLALLSTCAIVPAAGVALTRPWRDEFPASDYLNNLLGKVVSNRHSAIVLGISYLENHNDANGISLLKQSMLAMVNGDPERDMQCVKAHLQQRYHEDFVSHDSITLNHWLLPRSEARLFALLAQSARV